jgi:hypothetical protein
MSNSGGCENIVASVGGQGREKLSKEQLAAQHQARIDAMRPRRKKQIQVNSQIRDYLPLSVIYRHHYDELFLYSGYYNKENKCLISKMFDKFQYVQSLEKYIVDCNQVVIFSNRFIRSLFYRILGFHWLVKEGIQLAIVKMEKLFIQL